MLFCAIENFVQYPRPKQYEVIMSSGPRNNQLTYICRRSEGRRVIRTFKSSYRIRGWKCGDNRVWYVLWGSSSWLGYFGAEKYHLLLRFMSYSQYWQRESDMGLSDWWNVGMERKDVAYSTGPPKLTILYFTWWQLFTDAPAQFGSEYVSWVISKFVVQNEMHSNRKDFFIYYYNKSNYYESIIIIKYIFFLSTLSLKQDDHLPFISTTK